jgi:hypothetical protein
MTDRIVRNATALAALAMALPLAALSPDAEAAPEPSPHEGRHAHSTHETDEPETGYFAAPRYSGQCERGVFTGRAYGNTVNASGDEWSIQIFHGLCELEVEMEGEVELRPDGRGIERMGRGARMTIEEDARVDRKLEVTAGSNGVPQYRWTVGGEARPIEDEARTWFRDVLTEVFRATGFQAEERVAHFLDRGGVPAVLAEVEHITSDHVAGLYFHATLAGHRVSAAEAATILELAGETLGSDHELSELMTAVPIDLLSDRRVRAAYVGAARSIGSDHDLSRVLIELIDRGRTDRATVEAVLRAAETIGSDHDLSRLLVRIAEEVPLDGDLRRRFLDRAEDVGSDHDHDRVIAALER